MTFARRFGWLLWRGRYAVYASAALSAYVPMVVRYGLGVKTDWWVFEAAGRVIDGWSKYQPHNALRLFADRPYIQMGPPPVLVSAALQPFGPRAEEWAAIVLLLCLAVLTVCLVDRAAIRLSNSTPSRRGRVVQIATGAATSAVLAYGLGAYRHLDDAIALAAFTFALALIADETPRRRRWWLVAIALGIAAAAKPWAVIFLPLLAALPRHERVRGAALAMLVVAAWWLPFLLAAPDTLSALSSYHVVPAPGSVPALFGVHGDVSHWLRPVQLDACFALTAFVVVRREWVLAPIAGLAMRTLFDPYVWQYYGMGPVVAAVLVDAAAASQRRRWAGVWTCGAITVEYGVPALGVPMVSAAIRVTAALVVVGIVIAVGSRVVHNFEKNHPAEAPMLVN